jgi:CRISPR/Cas system CMR-associated protein Cmr5 small subunit
MEGDAQAVLQASMAETQRRTAEDQARLAFDAQKLQADQQNKAQERDAKIAMNAENNLTQERIKTAELTVDEVKLRKEQEETAIQLNQSTQRNLGA